MDISFKEVFFVLGFVPDTYIYKGCEQAFIAPSLGLILSHLDWEQFMQQHVQSFTAPGRHTGSLTLVTWGWGISEANGSLGGNW